MRLHRRQFFSRIVGVGKGSWTLCQEIIVESPQDISFLFSSKGVKVKYVCKTLPQTSCLPETLHAKGIYFGPLCKKVPSESSEEEGS